jgi:excisionase family DNA binding protein
MTGRDLWDTKRCARFLGIREWTLRAWVSQRRIPFVKCGRLVRFSPDKIAEWIEENSVAESKEWR